MSKTKPDAKDLLSICESCEMVRIISVPFAGTALFQCKICNCLMNAKVRLVDADCPLNKFPGNQ